LFDSLQRISEPTQKKLGRLKQKEIVLDVQQLCFPSDGEQDISENFMIVSTILGAHWSWRLLKSLFKTLFDMSKPGRLVYNAKGIISFPCLLLFKIRASRKYGHLRTFQDTMMNVSDFFNRCRYTESLRGVIWFRNLALS